MTKLHMMMHNTSNKIEDFKIGYLVRDWAVDCDGRLGFVVGYPKPGGYSKEVERAFPYGISHENYPPCVITVTNDGKFHVRSIYCQELVKID